MSCCELLHLLEVTCRSSLRVDIEVVDLDLNSKYQGECYSRPPRLQRASSTALFSLDLYKGLQEKPSLQILLKVRVVGGCKFRWIK